MKQLERIHDDSLLKNVTRRQFLRLVSLGIFVVAVEACQLGQVSQAVPTNPGPVEIRYATGGATPPAEIEMAIFSDYLKKSVLQHYGKEYTLNIIVTKGTPEAQTLLIAGQADLATFSFATIATTVSKNAIPDGISVVAAHYIDGQAGYGTNPYLVLADSGIQSAADLKGKTLGVNAVGTAVDVILRVYLQKNGIDPKTDVKFAEVGFGAMGAALREKRVDLGSFVQPFAAVEQGKGGVRTLFTSKDAVGPNSAIATVARNRFLKEHPQAVRAFLDDWVRGFQWLSDEKNRDQALQIMSDISKTPVETLGLFYGKPGIDYYRDPRVCPSAQALQVGVDAMVSQGLLDMRIEIASLINTSYLPQSCK